MKIFQVKENFKNFCSTKFALIWMNIFNEPFVALYSLILFILRKDLNASAFQISIFVTIRPVIALFSFYWSSNLSKRKNKLVSNLMGAWVLARLPFVLLPFFPNVWYLIFACSNSSSTLFTLLLLKYFPLFLYKFRNTLLQQ